LLFNAWKHHAGALRHHIAAVAGGGAAALGALPGRLLVLGTGLMDLYTGPLAPAGIGERRLAGPRGGGRHGPGGHTGVGGGGGGYRVLEFADDRTRWVLRVGEEKGRYVHVHPGRWTPATRRVRANVLRTAVMVWAHVAVHGGSATDVDLVNRVRVQSLGLAPVRDLAGEQGLGTVLHLLRPA